MVRSPTTPVICPDPSLARLLAVGSIVLPVVFLAAVLTSAMPPKLLDPTWQLQLAATLISYATLPLVGTLLMPLAQWVDPGNQRLRARWLALRCWTLAAAIGFLLLIPLQIYAGLSLYRNVTGTLEQQTSQSAEKLADLRQSISTAATHQELQALLQKFFGRNAGLSASERRLPMAELRSMLLAKAEQASQQLMRQVEAQAAMKPDQLVKETIRIAISALAYAIGFAFLAGALPRGRASSSRRRR